MTEQEFHENLLRQTTMSPQTVAELQKHGVTDETMLKLEFFFYTNSGPKAQSLAAALKKLGYAAKASPSASDRHLLVITGWTTPMKMDSATVTTWTDQMCRLGFQHDCEFDGWGTNPP